MLKTGTLISAAVLSFGLVAGTMAADAPKADAAAAPAAAAPAATDAPKPKKRKKAVVNNPVKHVHFSNFIVQ